MYKLSRLFFGWSLVLGMYVIVVGAAMIGPLALYGLLGIAIFAIRMAYVKRPVLQTLASGRFAEKEEMRAAGMLDVPKGLILGWYGGKKRNLFGGIKALFSKNVGHREACESFFHGGKDKGELVRLPQAVHTVCFAPSRSGKGASLILPWAFSVNESAIFIDLKGELAFLSCAARERMGHKVVILDPFKVVTQ
jgi:type IV secretion system protein VirD4